MYLSRWARVSLLCALTSVGCDDGGRITTPPDANVAQDGSPVALPRAVVHKDLFFTTAFGGGPPTNLALLVGTEASIEEVCADPSAGPLSPQKGIAVETPSGKVPSHAVSREAFVQVFEFSAGLVASFCDLVGAPLVATGTVFFTQAVNQILGPGTGPGSFTVHATVHGIVELTGGGVARLHGTWGLVVRPDGTLVKDQQLVTLTPL